MSLDVTLRGETVWTRCRCSECGYEHAVEERPCLWSRNITHNLGRMAGEAGLYAPLWRPDEHGWTRARDLVDVIRVGLVLLESDPQRFRAFDSPNGWGRYEHLVAFTRAYLAACEQYPDATVEVSR